MDDFAIRKNRDLIHWETSETNSAEWGSILIITAGMSELGVEISGLENLETSDAATPDIINDYSFEVYLWIDNQKPIDGTESSEQLFTDEDKWEWIGGEDIHEGENPLETGYDFTRKFPKGTVTFKDDATNDKRAPEMGGYEGRYNLYRGISGTTSTDGNGGITSVLGDTPYIKVSVHVQKHGEEVATTAELTPIYPIK